MMKITNTMCRLRDLTQEQIDSLVVDMPRGNFDFFKMETGIGATTQGNWGTWDMLSNPTIVKYKEMMQLLGKTMEFTKSDLRTGMFVKQRDGMFMAVLDDRAVGNILFTKLSDIQDNLLANNFSHLDIVAVYKPSVSGVMDDYMRGVGLATIWERTEQTPAQKGMEELQLQISKLQEQAKVLQSKL
jgi:hypothetical protein